MPGKNSQPPPDADCPCGSGRPFSACCGPLLAGERTAETAEALMGSRYTAHVLGNADYLRRTWHPATCPPELTLADDVQWRRLRVLRVEAGGPADIEGVVAFEATFKQDGRAQRLREVSRFTRVGGRWLYIGAEVD